MGVEADIGNARRSPRGDYLMLHNGKERTSPSLGNQMPRYVATSAAGREQVEALIADIERCDPGIRRVGHSAFDYNKLRAHVGLD